jgi:hypothetical protein
MWDASGGRSSGTVLGRPAGFGQLLAGDNTCGSTPGTLVDVHGRWGLSACDDDRMAVTDGGTGATVLTLPADVYGAQLGGGFVAWLEDDAAGRFVLRVRNLATGETRGYGPVSDTTLIPVDVDDDTSPRAAYVDASGTLRTLELSWAASPWRLTAGTPTQVHADPGIKTARLTWAPPAPGGVPVQSYVIRSSPGFGQWVVGADTHEFLFNQYVTPHETYTFTVTAQGAAIADPAPSATSNPVRPIYKPGFQKLTLVRTGRSVRVTWKPDGWGLPITGMRIRRDGRKPVTLALSRRSYTYRGLSRGWHRFTVQVDNALGHGLIGWQSVRVR